MERKNGFLIVDDYKELPDDECIIRGRYADCWLENKEIYLFKKYLNVLTCYREVIFSRFATKIGIPNVGYDLASRYGKLGVITKKCTEEIPTSMKQLLFEYIKENFANKKQEMFSNFYPILFNVETIENILKERYKDKKNFIFQEVHEDLMTKFISQFLLANCDLNTKNLDFEESKGKFLPLYDFGSCGIVHLKQWKGEENVFSLKWIYTEDTQEHPKKTLQTFLNTADSSEVDLFKMYLEKACAVSLDDLFEELESEMHAFFPNEAKMLQRRIEFHLNDLQKQCKK